jgi:hypothetical protein
MNKKQTLIIGDVITFAILTYIGFASHGEGELALLPRMGTTLFPILFGWFLLAPWFGLFHENVTTTQQDLVLRAPLAMLFVAPLASILRSAWLGSAALPTFTFVLAATNAVGIYIWRWLYYKLSKQNQ